MISGCTSRARCSAGSSGGWRSQTDDMDRYLQMLRDDPGELDLLAKDLLINVTSFFRDPKVFDFLAESVIPDLVADQPADQPLRIWIAGCSTGEETYSLAMLFREAIAAAGTQRQAAGLRLGCRRRRRGAGPGRPLSATDRGRRLGGAAGPLFRQGGARLPGRSGLARRRGLHGAGRAGRPAVLAPRLRVLPQSADLSAPGGAGEGHRAVPFRPARGRRAAAGRRRDGRRVARPLHRDLQDRAHLSPCRRAAGRGSSTFLRRRRRARPRARAQGPSPSRQTRSGRSVPAAGARDLRAGGGADQPQERMPVFARGRPIATCASPPGAADPRPAGHGAQRPARQAQIGDPAGVPGQCACRRRRLPRRTRRRRRSLQHRRRSRC